MHIQDDFESFLLSADRKYINSFFKKFITCTKISSLKCGILNTATNTFKPWEYVSIDFIGPWKFTDSTGLNFSSKTVATIDVGTRWPRTRWAVLHPFSGKKSSNMLFIFNRE